MAKMKVFGANLDGRYRGIVAATSQANAAALLGLSLHSFREYGCQTGNRDEIALAMQEPGVAWRISYERGSHWQRMQKREE